VLRNDPEELARNAAFVGPYIPIGERRNDETARDPEADGESDAIALRNEVIAQRHAECGSDEG